MLQQVVRKAINKENLSEDETYIAVNEIMQGKCTPAQITAFLIALRMKGETIDEITGSAKAMRDNALYVKTKIPYIIDTCGTGGDGGKTFNISTAVAIIAAAAGVKVAKHGNRAVSSKSGSADVLLELGIDINLEPEHAAKYIEQNGMAFLFAQKYHSAMKNVALVRKEIEIRTIFNILGPLTNPAFVKGQFLGVYNKDLTHTLAVVLSKLGCERALVVHGEDGLDEITTTSTTYISELINNKVKDYEINPENLGIAKVSLEDIKGGDARENAEIILNILKGEKGARRDIVVLNTSAALYVGKMVSNLEDGIKLAEGIIDSGKAYNKLNELRECSRRIS